MCTARTYALDVAPGSADERSIQMVMGIISVTSLPLLRNDRIYNIFVLPVKTIFTMELAAWVKIILKITTQLLLLRKKAHVPRAYLPGGNARESRLWWGLFQKPQTSFFATTKIYDGFVLPIEKRRLRLAQIVYNPSAWRDRWQAL